MALPVAQGEAIWRSQLRYRLATDDPSPKDRKTRTLVAPQTLVYGLTPRLSLFAKLPLLVRRSLDSPGARNGDPAVGNPTLLGRYILYADDYAPLSTRRMAFLAGVKLPTGADRFGTSSFDPLLGGVATWAADRTEVDLDALFTLGTKRHGFDTGNRFRYDVAYRYRLWPLRFGTGLRQLNGLVELNGLWTERARNHGRRVRDSGGHVLFLSPGVQLVSLGWIFELSFQIPVVEKLRGDQVETDWIGVVSVRIPFAVR